MIAFEVVFQHLHYVFQTAEPSNHPFPYFANVNASPRYNASLKQHTGLTFSGPPAVRREIDRLAQTLGLCACQRILYRPVAPLAWLRDL